MTTPANPQRPFRSAHFSTPASGQQSPRPSSGGAVRRVAGSHAAPRSAATSRAASRSSAAHRAASRSAAPRAGARPASTGSALTTNRMSAAATRATRRAGSHNVRREQTKRRGGAGLVVGGILAVVIVALAVVFVVVPSFNQDSSGTQQIETGQVVTVTVADGAGAKDVAQALFDAKAIASKNEFLTQVSRMNAESSLKSGTYSITVGGDLSSLIELLTTGPNTGGISLTIPEGYTLARIAQAVQDTLGISSEEFLAQAKASNYVGEYPFLEGAGNDSLEGFLFPKTYSFGDGATADGVIKAMLTQFQTELASVDLSYAEGRGLSVAQIVNLASIVEKESTPSTQAAVAAVFWNRLENMGDPNYGLLQSDATTAYSVGHDPTAAEVHDESDPYSTYVNKGLPPTPICCPGIEAIKAVCAPDSEYLDNGYYYFYFYNDADGNVQYVFSQTYEEHQQAIADAQG